MISPTFAPDVGGVETMLTNLCDYLAKRRFMVDVLTYNPLIVRTKAPTKEKLNSYVTVWRIPWPGYGLFNVLEHYPPLQFIYLVPMLTLAIIAFLWRFRQKPDIIHAFGLSGATAGGLASQLFNVPCVVDMCTVYRFKERPLLGAIVKRILGWSDFIRGNNVVGRQELIDIGIDPHRIGIITPPVDESVFHPILQSDARSRLGLPHDAFVALFVGRMVESKGVDIAAAASQFVSNPKVVFVFVGEGPLRKLVEDAAARDSRIIIKNNVKHHDLVFYYNAADILMCAPVDKNLVAFVGREAILCGLPILAAKVAVYFGIPYSVNSDLIPSKIGKLFDPKPEALAECLEELARCSNKDESYSFDRKACRVYGLAHYSRHAMDWVGDTYEKTKGLRFSC